MEPKKVISALLASVKVEGIATSKGSREISLCRVGGGRPTRVSINSSKEKNVTTRQLSAKDVIKVQSVLGLSQRKTIGMASMFRSALRNRKAYEPGLKKKISNRLHSLDIFFEHKNIDFTIVKGKNTQNIKQDVVFCKDLNGLIKYVKDKRNVSAVHLKFGIDGGVGFLKVNLSIQSTQYESTSDRHRQKYEDGAASKQFLDTGVKKLFIIGSAKGVQENHENVSKLWTLVNINSAVEGATIAVDLKLVNIISGLMAHSSLYPCTWCIVRKDQLNDCDELRTYGSATDNYLKWRNFGGNPNTAKNYFNCVKKPIFTGEDGKIILDIVPPPELHLMLGVVNSMYNHMLKQSEVAALLWAKSCHVERDITNGGTGFNGNSCKTLLNNVDLLRSICPIDCLKFVRAFNDFKNVVEACFGRNLDPQFQTHIYAFKQSYLDLDISATPNVHCVFYHVEQFCAAN